MNVDFFELGQNIKKYRKIKGLTQEQLANATGYTDSHIGQIENAYGVPSFEAVMKIANALDVTLDQLAYGNIQNLEGYFVQELIRLTGKFSDRHKKLAIDMTVSMMEQLQKYVEEEKN